MAKGGGWGEEEGQEGGLLGDREIVSRGTLSPDLKDMSPMVLSCGGPDNIFDSHKLILNVSLPDAKRLRVFCARGKRPGMEDGLCHGTPFISSLSVFPALPSLLHHTPGIPNSHSLRAQPGAPEGGTTNPIVQGEKWRHRCMNSQSPTNRSRAGI